MKILIITQFFYPENFKSSDLAFELQKRGHEVEVLTGLPNYPEGKLYKGYGFFKNRRQKVNGVKIMRVLVFLRGKGGIIRLFLNYYSFVFFASIKAFFLSFRKKYDAVIVHESSPITQFYPALVYKKMTGTPVYFWVLDLWPESIIAGGVNNKLVYNYFKRMVIGFYKESEKILISCKGFQKSIEEKGDFSHKIEYFPNWAEETILYGDTTYPIPNLPEGFRVMFTGNIGEAQDMENVLNCALLLKDTDVKIILVGDGRKMDFVKNFIFKNKLQNTVFVMGRFPLESMASFFDKADALLVSLKDSPIFSITVPAKIQAYLSSGKPIIGMINGEGAQLINEIGAGLTCNAGDYNCLAKKILYLKSVSDNERLEMGVKGKKYFIENFMLSECMDNIERILNLKTNNEN